MHVNGKHWKKCKLCNGKPLTQSHQLPLPSPLRGTWSITDVIIDVICDEEEFLGGFAHRGILRGARKLIKEVEGPLIEAFQVRR